MPAIPTFEQRTQATGNLGPGATHDVAGAAANAGVLGELGAEAADTFNKVQISHNAYQLADTTSKALGDLDAYRGQLAADPDYDSHSSKYLAYAQKVKQQYSQQLQGNPVQGLFQEDFDKVAQANSVGVAVDAQKFKALEVRQNLDSTGQALSSLTGKDEATDQVVKAQYSIALHNASIAGNITPAEQVDYARKFSEGVIDARVRNDILADPVGALHKIESDQYEGLSGVQHAEWQAKAKIAVRAQQEDALRLQALQQKNLEVQQKATQQTLISKFVDGSLDARTVLNSNLDAFGSGSKHEFLDMLGVTDGGTKKLKTDPATFNALFARIHLDDGDPNKITNENTLNQSLLDNKLSIEDLEKLRHEVAGSATSDGANESKLKNGLIEVAKSSLTRSNPLLGIRDPEGDAQLQSFTSWFQSAYQKARDGGKSAQDLLDPTSADYLGKRIQLYARSPQQIMDGILKGATAAPAVTAIPRQPGESPDDYLKRTTGK